MKSSDAVFLQGTNNPFIDDSLFLYAKKNQIFILIILVNCYHTPPCTLQQPLYRPRLFDVTFMSSYIKFSVKSVIFALRVVVCPAYPTVLPDDLDLLCSLDGHKQTKDKENQSEASVANDPSLMFTTCWTAGQMYAPLLWCALCILCMFQKVQIICHS